MLQSSAEWHAPDIACHEPADRITFTASGPTDLPAILQKNIFVARLTQSGVADFSLYGLWALREALEGDIPWSPASPPEYTIPIAHAWIAYAGDTLIKLVDDRVAAGKGGSLWQGQSGFCMDRWQFWKKRLDQLSKCNELDPELRALAVEAAARIGKLITDSGPATGS